MTITSHNVTSRNYTVAEFAAMHAAHQNAGIFADDLAVAREGRLYDVDPDPEESQLIIVEPGEGADEAFWAVATWAGEETLERYSADDLPRWKAERVCIAE